MATTSPSTDDGSFDPNDFEDDESATITSESFHSEDSLSSHNSIYVGQGQGSNNNDNHHHGTDTGTDGISQENWGGKEAQVFGKKFTTNNNTDLTEENEATYLSVTVTNSSSASSAKSCQSSDKAPLQTVIHANGDIESCTAEQRSKKRFFIIKSTYPKYSKWDTSDPEAAEYDRKANTVHEIVHPMIGFDSEFQAEYEARRFRNNCEQFQGACAPLEDNDDGEISFVDEDDFLFTSFDEPPWDSELIENNDRNEEVIIDIMTMKQYHQKLDEQQEDRMYNEDNEKRYQLDEAMKIYECKLRVRSSGYRAYYSYPTEKPWDVKAEMEVKESANWRRQNCLKMRPDIEDIRSFMWRGRAHGVFGHILQNCQGNDAAFEASAIEMQYCALFSHLKKCKQLDELFLQLNTDVARQALPRQHAAYNCVSHVFIKKMIHVAPQLHQLRVLSFGPSITLNPWALDAISISFPELERLDIAFALSMEFAPPYDGTDNDKFYPYEAPLLACANGLENLKRLDLGFEMVQIPYTDASGKQRIAKKNRTQFLVSKVALDEIRDAIRGAGGTVTETSSTIPPSWDENEADGDLLVLQEMIQSPDLDDTIREGALERYYEVEAMLAEESSIESNVQPRQSNIDLLLEASICHRKEMEKRLQEQASPPTPVKDILVERKSLDTVSDNETLENVGSNDPRVNDEAEDKPDRSQKRPSNERVDDSVNSNKRVCVYNV